LVLSHAQEDTELTNKQTNKKTNKQTNWNLMGNLCYARKHSVQLFVQVFYTVKLHSLT
jgi:hypothetical protein